MKMPKEQTTSIATSTKDDVYVRGKSLCQELIGKLTFTEMLVFQMLGRRLNASETRVVDACLVALMEHGLTPSAIATRLTYTSAKESMQAAVAAGLLGVGSLFVGTVEGCGMLLDLIRKADDPAGEADRIAREHREAGRPVPGFGHPQHKPDDPRSLRLFEIADETGIAGEYTQALRQLAGAVDRYAGKHVTINATGAIAALLADCGVPCDIMRGFAIITRCAGLVGHVREEQSRPSLRAIWEAAERAVPYDGPSRR